MEAVEAGVRVRESLVVLARVLDYLEAERLEPVDRGTVTACGEG